MEQSPPLPPTPPSADGVDPNAVTDAPENRDELNAHSPELEIEGIVQGEADNNIVQSSGGFTKDELMEKVYTIRICLSIFYFSILFSFSLTHNACVCILLELSVAV